MNALLEFLKTQAHGQFVGGGLVLMFTGSVVALMRRTPGQLYGWVRGRFTRTITVHNDDPLFDYVTYWLNSQERFRRARFLKATTQLRLEQSGNSQNTPCSISESSAPSKKQTLRVFYSPSTGNRDER